MSPKNEHRSEMATGYATSIGHVRERQEDRLLAAPAIIAVADGMGGLARGDVAADMMIQALRSTRLPGSTAGARAEIKKAIARAAHRIRRSQPKGIESGTTVVGAVLGRATAKDSWLIFHVGDSRMYSYLDGELESLTVDHSVVQELIDSGMLSREEARYDPRRSIVTRAVGTTVSAEPVFRHVEARGQILIACSDGVTDELTNWEISDVMHSSRHGSLDEMAQALVDAALEAGGRDNATVVLAKTLPTERDRR